MSNDDSVLLEEMNGKFDVVIEAVGQMQDQMKLLAKQEDLEEVKRDVADIKAAVTDHSSQLSDYEHRITSLEAA